MYMTLYDIIQAHLRHKISLLLINNPDYTPIKPYITGT